MIKKSLSKRIKKKFLSYTYIGRKLKPDTKLTSKIYLNVMKFINYKEYKLRKLLFKENRNFPVKIDANKSYLIKNYKYFNKPDLIIRALNNLKLDYNKINWEKEKLKSKKPFLITLEKGIDKNIKTIVEEIFPVITNYIGLAPAITSIQFWYSPNKENVAGRSQNWHLDGEDFKQLKVFLPMDNICSKSGPLFFIDSTNSNILLKKLVKLKIVKKRNTKIEDEIVKKNLNKSYHKMMTMNFGDIGFIDTSNCYHFGSRKDLKPRKLLMIQFTSSFCIDLPSIFRKK